MKSLRLVLALFVSTLFYSCLVPPATTYKVVVPEETLMRYRKFIPSDERITSSSYQKVVTELPDGSTRVRLYYPDKYQCIQETTYAPNDNTVLHGTYKEWWDDGYKKTDGNYVDGKKADKWSYYNLKDGLLNSEVNYKNDKKEGQEIFYDNEKIKSSYSYQYGVKEGDFIVYDSLGTVTNQGIYKSDTIFSQSLQVESMDAENFKIVQEMPMFDPCTEVSEMEARKTCAQKKMLIFIYSNLKYPADARERDIEGTARIRYIVEKDGSIKDISVIRGVCSSIEKECIRVIEAMPKWVPGMQNGEPVKVQFNLPIKFKLQ